MPALPINKIPETLPDAPVNEIPETPPRMPVNEIPETLQHQIIQLQNHNPWASQDRRQKILLMTYLGYSQRIIAQYLDITRYTVLYTQHVHQATPKKSKGRPPKLSNK